MQLDQSSSQTDNILLGQENYPPKKDSMQNVMKCSNSGLVFSASTLKMLRELENEEFCVVCLENETIWRRGVCLNSAHSLRMVLTSPVAMEHGKGNSSRL